MDRRTMLIGAAVTTALAALPARAAPARGASTRSAALKALFDQFMKENLDLSPVQTTSLGLDHGERAWQKSEIDDTSEFGIARQKKVTADQLERLRRIDRASLNRADRVDFDVVFFGLQTGADANQRFPYGPGGAGAPYILSQLSGNYQQIPSFLDNQHTIETRADAEAYLSRLGAFAVSMDQEIEVARHDLGLGVLPPDFALAKCRVQLEALRAPDPIRSTMTESIARRTRARHIAGDWEGRAAALLRDRVYPALDRQIALVRELQARAPHDAGVWRLPEGDAYYHASLKYWATTDRAPAEIHQLGLQLVAEHTARIDALMKKLGMTTGTVGERLRAMYNDTKARYANTDEGKEELIHDLNARVQRVRALLPKWFGSLPKANVIIKRVPKATEAGAPGGYYQNASLDGRRPGIYWINLRDTAEVPRWTLPTLTYHESIPGHHLQLSIQQEAGLPLIRKVSFFGAYAEGWALYAEQLAVEMGLYADDPAGEIGQLHDAMFRAARMVVDTGMHAMQWSRERAIQYYVDTLGDPETSAITEIERYCVWPGQACSYMLGKLALLAERERARRQLGAKFDIRRFHDAMLLSGSVPLEVLDTLYANAYGTAAGA